MCLKLHASFIYIIWMFDMEYMIESLSVTENGYRFIQL